MAGDAQEIMPNISHQGPGIRTTKEKKNPRITSPPQTQKEKTGNFSTGEVALLKRVTIVEGVSITSSESSRSVEKKFGIQPQQ